MQTINLSGAWNLSSGDKKHNINAQIPGCNYVDLMKAGIISDPFDKLNEKSTLWVGETDWIYEKSFVLNESFTANKAIMLNISGVDTIASIYINEQLIAKTENAHICYSFDIKNILAPGDNKIRIEFSAPINYILEKNKTDRMPINMNGLQGFPHIRKPACHFGWDWGPTLPSCGITGKIELVGHPEHFVIRDTNVNQVRSENMATLTIKAKTNCAMDNSTVKVTVLTPKGEKLFESNMKSEDGISFEKEIFINNPEKWYANGMTKKTEQPLYTVICTTIIGDCECDVKVQKIGIRSIKLDRAKDIYGENFAFVVNGDTIFAKGANWIPSDSFITRLDDAKLEYLIRSMAVSNINMVRVWGGGYYESDKFYELCDRFGILVWQDFCFACAPYPFYNDEFLANVKAEVESVIKRLRHHASLAVWCGNNEIEMMSAAWMARVKLTKYTEIFFYDILPKLVDEFDNLTAFINGSPTGNGYMKSTNSDATGDTHLWHVWHGLQPFKYYRTRFTRFCSEFGFESLPDIDTIKSFTGGDVGELDIVSKTMQAHQKCNSGNEKMLYYAIDNFLIPDNFYDLVYITQLVQAESIKEAVEHWRRNKGRCNGALYWQYNDCWPTASWSSVDYYGRWKALQYYAKEFFAPLTISLYEEKGKVNLTVSNETIDNVNYEVKLNLLSYDGKVIHTQSIEKEILPFTAKNFEDILENYELQKSDFVNSFVAAELWTEGKMITKRTLVLQKPNKLNLQKANILKEVELNNGILSVHLKSNTYVHRLYVHLSDSIRPFSDNFFDLLPNEVKTVKIPAGNRTLENCNGNIKITCYNNLTPKYTKLKSKMLKAKIALMPMNIIQRIGYKFT